MKYILEEELKWATSELNIERNNTWVYKLLFNTNMQ